MKSRYVFVPLAICLILACRLTQSATHEKSDGGGVRWSAQSIDLGTVLNNQNFECTFPFTNDTSLPITLQPEACCGIRAAVNPKTVAPHSSGSIRLTGQTFWPAAGVQQVRIVKVRAHELPTYYCEIQVHYRLHPTWHLVPENVSFQAMKEGTTAARKLRLYYDPGAPKCIAVRSSDPNVKARLLGRTSDHQDIAVSLKTRPGQHNAVKSDFLLISEDPSAHPLAVAVNAVIRPCAQVVPPQAFFDSFPKNKPLRMTLAIKSDVAPFNAGVLSVPSWIHAAIVSQKGHTASLVLTAKAPAAGAYSDNVVLSIKTTHRFTVTIPVTGLAE